MDKTQIEQRITLLEQEKENVRMNLLAYEGALQDCKFWLSELEKSSIKNEKKEKK